MIGNARNNLPGESQTWAKALKDEVTSLRRELNLIKSQDINRQLNRLAVSAGNSLVSVIPVSLSGSVTGAKYPVTIDFRYDWVVLNLTGKVQSILTGVIPPTYLNNISVTLLDGSTAAAIASSTALLAANPGTPSTAASVSLNAAFRVSDLTPNVQPYFTITALSEGFVETTQNVYSITGSIMQFKDN